MKRIIFLICLFPAALCSQNIHLSARLGMANYQGDLQDKPITLNQARLFGSFGARYDINEHLAARTYISLFSLRADDKKGTVSMQQRNLNFRTRVLDWEMGLQYNFFSLNDRWWTPYIFAGAGLFHFNPYTYSTSGAKTYLQPLSTEGEGFEPGVKSYKLTQIMIPFGFGAEYALNEDMRIGIELGYRKLFTDYLDDVSNAYVDQSALLAARGQTAVDLAYRGYEVGAGPYPPAKTKRGNDKNSDASYYFALTFTVRSFVGAYKRIAGLPAYRREKKVGCPANRH